MLTQTTLGKKCGGAVLALSLLAGSGCAHRELTAPCADYKAAAYTAGVGESTIPCDTPLQMQRPPWVTASEPTPPSAKEG